MKFNSLRRTIQAEKERRAGVAAWKMAALFYVTATVAFIIFTR